MLRAAHEVDIVVVDKRIKRRGEDLGGKSRGRREVRKRMRMLRSFWDFDDAD
jgi:hypothetical protein